MPKTKKKGTPTIVIADCALACKKEQCPKWVILTQKFIDKDNKEVSMSIGKCAIAWLPNLLIELNTSIKSFLEKKT